MTKQAYSSPNYKLWYKLTQKVMVWKNLLKRKYLKDYAFPMRIDGCNETLKKGLMSNEEINADGGIVETH